jgi:hypothetical protein
LAGAVILAGLLWAISWLLDTQQIDQTRDTVTPTSPATSPTSATTPRGGGQSTVAMPLAAAIPLGPEDDGFRVIVRGTVLAEPLEEGFWILADEDEVLFVRTTEPALTNQDLTMTGTLRQIASAEGAAWAERAKLREAAGWKVHRDLYLEVESPVESAAESSEVPENSKTGKDPRRTRRDTT